MKHQLNIKGSTEKQAIVIDIDNNKFEFDLSQDIKAQSIFDLLNFNKGDTYQLDKGVCGTVAPSSFDAFCDLMQAICDKANGLFEQDATQCENKEQSFS